MTCSYCPEGQNSCSYCPPKESFLRRWARRILHEEWIGYKQTITFLEAKANKAEYNYRDMRNKYMSLQPGEKLGERWLDPVDGAMFRWVQTWGPVDLKDPHRKGITDGVMVRFSL